MRSNLHSNAECLTAFTSVTPTLSSISRQERQLPNRPVADCYTCRVFFFALSSLATSTPAFHCSAETADYIGDGHAHTTDQPCSICYLVACISTVAFFFFRVWRVQLLCSDSRSWQDGHTHTTDQPCLICYLAACISTVVFLWFFLVWRRLSLSTALLRQQIMSGWTYLHTTDQPCWICYLVAFSSRWLFSTSFFLVWRLLFSNAQTAEYCQRCTYVKAR
jgi:uncharacterized membrane protein